MRSAVRGILAGAGLAVAIASVLMAAAVLVGLAPWASLLVFVGGAVGAAAFIQWGSMMTATQRVIGVATVWAGALVTGVLSGFGLLEGSALVGSAMAAIPAVSLRVIDIRVAAWVWVPATALVLILLVPEIINGGTLGHDEAAYGLKAKSWLYGTPSSGWNLHRGIGMSVYAVPVLATGGTEPALRTLGVVSLGALAGATWWLGCRVGSRVIGSVAAVVVLASPPMLRRATEYLSDIPSAALLVGVMAIVWSEFGERKLPSYRVLWMLPLAWTAFYLRYQSLLALALIGVTIALLWWRKVVERPRVVLVAIGIGFLGFIPHFISARIQTGSVLGILTYATTSGGRDFTGDGLFKYVAFFGWGLSYIVAPLLILSVAWWLMSTRKEVGHLRLALFLVVPAALQVFALGILGEAHARFVFFPYALLAVAGVLGFTEATKVWNSLAVRQIAVAFLMLLSGVLGLSMASSRKWVEDRSFRNEPVQIASEVIQAEVGESDCSVLTSYAPQITYYSECVSDIFRPNLEASAAVDRLPGYYKYMLLLNDGKRQPEGANLDDLVGLSSADPVLVEGDQEFAILYRFVP